MLTIEKRSGKEEEFSKGKIRNSMLSAGITRVTAEAVSESIHYHEGMTTAEVRNRVIGGIKNREPQAAKQFESHPKKSHNT
ncbi:MAG: ATP cone domain-containing protein [Candidatus Zixiibacteriota bacterium]